MYTKLNREYLEIFLRCSICKNIVPYNSGICEYCGGIISYDENSECYISSRQCFKCGYDNKADSQYCENCRSKFTFVCPKCKNEVEEAYCKRCGFRIDEFYIENEVDKRLTLVKTGKSRKIGLYLSGLIFLSLTLFLTILGIGSQYRDIRRIGFVIGAAIFFALFLSVLISLIKNKK